MIAEAERVDGEETGQPSGRRTIGPAEQEPQRQQHEDHVERVDLGDDGLAPERVRDGEEQSRADRRGDRSRELGGDHHEQAAGDRRLDRRREVERIRRLGAADPERDLADGEVEGVAVARRDDRRSDRRLKRSGVAEVEARQQRRAIQGGRAKATPGSRDGLLAVRRASALPDPFRSAKALRHARARATVHSSINASRAWRR